MNTETNLIRNKANTCRLSLYNTVVCSEINLIPYTTFIACSFFDYKTKKTNGFQYLLYKIHLHILTDSGGLSFNMS